MTSSKRFDAFLGSWRFLAVLGFFGFLFYLVSPQTASAAASLFLFPPSGTYQVGDTFTVSLRVDPGDSSINAADGTLIFNPAEVRVQGVSKNSSVFNLWTSEPVFSNTAGTITFGGGTTKSYGGNPGTILTVTFVSRASASSRVSFSSGSVLAADGKGTNILSNMSGGDYTFQPAIQIPAPAKTPGEVLQPAGNANVPYAPVVTSTTHSDPDIWYANNSPEFSWQVPQGITALRLEIDQQPFSTPAKSYPADTVSKTIDILDDGIWYFHIQFKNDAGWGSILHRKVMIDTRPPSPFTITVDNGGDATDPSPVLKFSANDATAGIAYYELRIGQGDLVRITPGQIKDGGYKIPLQAPGMHTVIVKAYDLAQNVTTATAEMTIEPLEAPAIDPLPVSARDGGLLTIKGSTKYQQAKVQVYAVREGEAPIEQEAIADSDGNWVLVYAKSLAKGAYQIWAQVQDARGAQSPESNKITLAVQPSAVARVGTVVVDYFGAIMILIGIIIIITALICGSLFAIARTRRRLRSRTENLSKRVYVAFDALRQELREQVEYLDGKPGLSKTEKAVADKLKEALDDSEKFIAKEIKNIKKELK